MVKKDLIKAGKFEEIERLTAEAVTKMLGFTLSHVGINTQDEASANKTADTFEAFFGMAKKDGKSSVFAGTGIEIMKTPYLGANGHIAVGTNDMERAVYHLERRGISFDDATAKRDEKGKLKAIYLKDEIGGFAVHLVQK